MLFVLAKTWIQVRYTSLYKDDYCKETHVEGLLNHVDECLCIILTTIHLTVFLTL